MPAVRSHSSVWIGHTIRTMDLTSTGACVLGLLQMGPAPGQPGFLEGEAMTGGQVYAAAERSVGRRPGPRHERGVSLADDMLRALGRDRSLPGAALMRRAAYQRLMVEWLGEVLDRIV